METSSESSVSLGAVVASIQEILNYRFGNPSLLAQALDGWKLLVLGLLPGNAICRSH